MDWSNDLILEFIQLYELHPVLWDPKHKNHRNRNSLFDAWQNIAENISVDITVDILKKKKESLMATYRSLAKKVRLSSSTGSGAEDIYVPSWFAYTAIDRFVRGTTKKIPSLCSEEFINDILPEDEIIQYEEEMINNENKEPEVQNNDTLDGQSRKRTDTTSMFSQHQATLKKNRKRDPNMNQIDRHLKQASDVLTTLVASNSQTRPLQDQPALYGQLLAEKLRRLSRRTQLTLQNQIDNLVFEAELDEINSVNYSKPRSPIPLNSVSHSASTPSTSSGPGYTHKGSEIEYYYETTPEILEYDESDENTCV